MWSHTGKLINKIDKKGYIKCSFLFFGKVDRVFAHQFIYYMVTGIIPIEIDHLDHNPSNNKFSNLENGTRSENQQNRKETKGYCWHKRDKKWRASIRIDGKVIYIGNFNTEEEARQAYLNGKAIYHPKKANLFTKK